MRYKLTLTPSERQAIDWIGDRYSHGTELSNILHEAYWRLSHHLTAAPSEINWDQEDDIEFELSEAQAWIVRQFIEQDDCACLSEDFKAKLLEFCNFVV